jgi:zinc protease
MNSPRLALSVLFAASLGWFAPSGAHAADAAAPASSRTAGGVDGFTQVKTAGGITEYRLEANQLTVLLKEDHSAPVATFMVTYRVGSRNEVTGTTGATHLLEHLMFKGSAHFNADLGTGFDTTLDRIGATNNATTSLDRTNYYENLASDRLELVVQLEADRMRGLLLRESDRAPEMTVVRNEFERGENDPISALDKEISAAAFVAHPYHHPTIGWRSDIEKVSIEKLRGFYDTFYWPNNATVTVIGDFKPADVLGLIKKYYGPIPASPQPIPAVYTEEPPQQGPRRVTVQRPGELGVVGVAYKNPPGLHPDYPALVVLGDILADGKTSRLYRALVDENLAVGIYAYPSFNRDGFLFHLYAPLAPQAAHAQVEKILLAEVEKLKTGGVTGDEVARAISKETASTAYGRDGSFAIASQINEDIAAGDWTAYLTVPEKIQAVTADDVVRVAKTYLQEDQSTTGWFIPKNPEEPAAPGQAPAPAEADAAAGAPAKRSPVRAANFYRDPEMPMPNPLPNFQGRPPFALASPAAAIIAGGATGGGAAASGSAMIAPQAVRRSVAGIDRITLKTALEEVITVRGSLPAGNAFNPAGHPALADLTAGMLDRGTTKHDKFALAAQLEDVGAQIDFESSAENVLFRVRCLKKDLPLVLGLLAEQLRTPAFSADELEKLKKQRAGEFQQEQDDTDFRADQAFTRRLLPAGHPYRAPAAAEYLADLTAVKLDDVKAFHAAHYGPAGMVLVAVGDVDADALDRALGSAFAGWTGGHAALPSPKIVRAGERLEKIPMPGKASVSVLIGQPSGLKYSDPDRIALAVATEGFGGGYFSSRLMSIVRAREGLTYGIYAGLRSDSFGDGLWAIQATFAPELLDKGLASTRRELRRFVESGLTAVELENFKGAINGTYKLALATSGGLANQLLVTVQRGLPLDYIDRFPQLVQGLTLDQVNGAVKKYLDPDKMLTVTAGTLPDAK